MESNLVKTNHLEFSFFELVNDAVIISDKHGNIIFTNNKVEKLFGYNYEDIIAMRDGKLVSSFFDRLDTKIVVLPKKNGQPNKCPSSTWEKRLTKKSGETIWTNWTRSMLEDGNIIHTVQDISDQKKLNETAERLHAKNILLQQELQHRTKNNMQIVISLLNLQFRTISDKVALDALSKSKERMMAILTVHQFICSSQDLHNASFEGCFNRLLDNLRDNNTENNNIRLTGKFQGCFKTTKHLVSLGLIISELVMNAYQHAFQSFKGGTIQVSLDCHDDGRIVLSVTDNGSGLKSPLNLETSNTIGHEIILSLVHQIEGRISFSSENGTKVRIVYYQ